MIIEFSVANYLSFKEKVTLSLVAGAITEHPENLIDAGKLKLLKGAVIYGANSSGKSNLIKAMGFMKGFVLNSIKLNSTDDITIEPFALSTECDGKPSFFELTFYIDEVKYRYGFELTPKEVVTEWLFETGKESKSREKALFIREGQEVELHKTFKEGRNLIERTRENALFLSVVDQFGGEISRKLTNWFKMNFENASIAETSSFYTTTLLSMTDKSYNKEIYEIINKLDLGFKSIKIVNQFSETKSSNDQASKGVTIPILQKVLYSNPLNFKAKTQHLKVNKDKEVVEEVYFDLEKQESQGTNKIFNLLGAIAHAILEGTSIIIDELDASLHPLLTKAIIRYFQNPETNPKNAQLIISTHDTNLLKYGNYRRDQIYFVEKDKFGASNLYSLFDFKLGGKTARKDRDFENDYIQGRYGAIPFIGDFNEL